MSTLSTLAETLPGSQILAISQRIKERIAAGETIYNFTVGDYDPSQFPIPQKLEIEIVRAYMERYTNYPAAEGNLDLREAISNFINTFQNLHYATDEILCGSGGRPLIYAAYKTIVDAGDKVIYAVPSWNNLYYCKMTGAVPVEIETTEATHFMPTAKLIAPHMKDAVLLALCSPQNPTGTCFSKEALLEICELVVKENKRRGEGRKKLYVLFDQMYWLLLHGGTKHFDPVSVCPEIRPYVIYVDAISKSFASTGVRVGWAMGPKEVLNKMKAILSHVGAWPPMAEQKALTKFLHDEEAVKEYLKFICNAINFRLVKIYKGIMRMKAEGFPVDAIAPQGAIYLTVKINVPDAGTLLLEQAGIAVLPFSVFGADKDSRWCRISVGTCHKQDILPMLQKLKRALCPVTAG